MDVLTNSIYLKRKIYSFTLLRQFVTPFTENAPFYCPFYEMDILEMEILFMGFKIKRREAELNLLCVATAPRKKKEKKNLL